MHEVGSNNPDGVDIKQVKDKKTGIPLDAIPFHPYYTVKDLIGLTVFLIVFTSLRNPVIYPYNAMICSLVVLGVFILIFFL